MYRYGHYQAAVLASYLLANSPAQADDLLISAGGAWLPGQPAVAKSIWFDVNTNGFSSGGDCSMSKPQIALNQIASKTVSGWNDFDISVNCKGSSQSGFATTFNASLYRGGPQQNGTYNQGNAVQYYGVPDYSTADTNPGNLNWVINGRLSLWDDDGDGHMASNTYNVVIGQGDTGAYKNWWIGGSDLTGFVTSGTLMTNDGKFIITPGSNDHTFVAYRYQWPETDWMKNMPDETLMGSLSMPGTHDAGTYTYRGAANTITMTQNLSIRGQLNVGVRIFDIRLADQLQLTHGGEHLHLYLTDVIDQMSDFLVEHPGESIVMMLKRDDGSIDATQLKQVMYDWHPNTQYWTENRMPTLGDARGKIVVMSRVDSNPDNNVPAGPNPIGIAISGWPDNTTGTAQSPLASIVFAIQDHYSFASYPDPSPKLSDVPGLYRYINPGQTSVSYKGWPINYLSCTGTLSLTDLGYPASYVTTGLLNFFSGSAPSIGTFGSVMLDFAGIPVTSAELAGNPMTAYAPPQRIYSPEIANQVIQSNFTSLATNVSVAISSTASGVTDNAGSSGASYTAASTNTSTIDGLVAQNTKALTQRKDGFHIKVDLSYDGKTLNPLTDLTDKSCFKVKVGSYDLNKCLSEAVSKKLIGGKKTVVLKGEHEEVIKVIISPKHVSIDVMSGRQKGLNLVNLAGESGHISNSLRFSHRLHGTGGTCEVPYVGKVKEVKSGGLTSFSWSVKTPASGRVCSNQSN